MYGMTRNNAGCSLSQGTTRQASIKKPFNHKLTTSCELDRSPGYKMPIMRAAKDTVKKNGSWANITRTRWDRW